MTKTIDEVLIEVIAEKLGVERDDVIPDARFIEDLGADSLDLVELIMEMEEKFDVDIPDDDAENLSTVQDALDYIDRHSKIAA